MDKATGRSSRGFVVAEIRLGTQINLLKFLAVAALVSPTQFAAAQTFGGEQAWAGPAITHALQMRKFKDSGISVQQTPGVIPQFEQDPDSTGLIATFQPGGKTTTSTNAFFQNIATDGNGRTCFSCHQPQTGWTISAASAQSLFDQSEGNAPLFRRVDGATCPNNDVSTLAKRRIAYSLLLSKGLIRIGLPVPSNAEYTISVVSDPYNCNTNPPTPGIVSVYRRPLPSANLGFLSTIMWDGRETTNGFAIQALHATQIHAQSTASALTADQSAQILAFELGVFTAQQIDQNAGSVDSNGASGGPVALSRQLPNFFLGINDPFPNGNPKGIAFTPNIFDLYVPFDNSPDSSRQSIARGEKLFNSTPITITGVSGINGPGDALEGQAFQGFCGTCHDTPDVGNHSLAAPLNIGIANSGAEAPPALDISALPVFELVCVTGPLAGRPLSERTFFVTDPGRALISGKCADIGKVKGPILRGLAARAPYFHNGTGTTLLDVVKFYEQRFGIAFSDQDEQDLVNFLNSL